jgi:hypothetical protein
MGNNRKPVVNEATAPQKEQVKVPNSQLTPAEKNMKKRLNREKANPDRTAENKENNLKNKQIRIESGSKKEYS